VGGPPPRGSWWFAADQFNAIEIIQQVFPLFDRCHIDRLSTKIGLRALWPRSTAEGQSLTDARESRNSTFADSGRQRTGPDCGHNFEQHAPGEHGFPSFGESERAFGKNEGNVLRRCDREGHSGQMGQS
jgi:hypothetical protein